MNFNPDNYRSTLHTPPDDSQPFNVCCLQIYIIQYSIQALFVSIKFPNKHSKEAAAHASNQIDECAAALNLPCMQNESPADLHSVENREFSIRKRNICYCYMPRDCMPLCMPPCIFPCMPPPIMLWVSWVTVSPFTIRVPPV